MPSTAPHPRVYRVFKRDREVSLWVYCWTLTHGGRKTLPDEYRIQITSVPSPLPINPNGITVLLGFEPNRGVFAGFDLERHQSFTGRSPSVQIGLSTLNDCLQEGLAFQTKSNSEIAVGVRSDHLLLYCEHALVLHRYGNDAVFLSNAERAVKRQEADRREILGLPEQRQRVIRETVRWSRKALFRKQVLTAYENRCAVTRLQLKLVDAAHILPVSAGDQSIDTIRNGIALSPTYHRAFDRGLIYLDEGFEMRLNESAAARLAGLGLDAGIEDFAVGLGKIHLPYDAAQRPDPYFIRLANQNRGIQ